MITEELVPMEQHAGEALLDIGERYRLVFNALIESIKNELDAGADRIDVLIDKKPREIRVEGNGVGFSREKLFAKLRSIRKSENARDPNKTGKFGIGMFAFLGKCQQMVVTTQPKGEHIPYRKVTFDKDNLLISEKRPLVPVIIVPHLTEELQVGKNQKPLLRNNVWWQCQVHIDDYPAEYTKQGDLSVKAIGKAVQDGFSEIMKRNKTRLNVIVIERNGKKEEGSFEAKEYEGTPLPKVSFQSLDKTCKVIFKIYLARKGPKNKRRGELFVGTPYSPEKIPLSRFLKHTEYEPEWIDSELRKILNSSDPFNGVFEGELIANNCEPMSDWNGFKTDDSLKGFFFCLSAWYKEEAKSLLGEVEESAKDERYAKINEMATKSLEIALSGVYNDYSDIFKNLGKGIKEHEKDMPPRTPRKDRDKKIIEGAKAPAKKRDRTRNNTRKVSRDLGLQFVQEEMPGEDDLWKFDEADSTIRLNIRHPLWTTLETESDVALCRLQEKIAIHVIVTRKKSSDEYFIIKETFDEMLKLEVPLIKYGVGV